jgi:hypothetical protein
MIGIGKVFGRYAAGDLVDDSDVAQIHAPAELGYLPLSEPWVNIEPTLEKMNSAGLIDLNELQSMRLGARQLHFKERTYRKLFESVAAMSPGRVAQLVAWTTIHAVDQKRVDALELVNWLAASSNRCEARPTFVFSETSQWLALLDELQVQDHNLSQPVQDFRMVSTAL